MDNKSKLIDFAEHLKQADGLLITAGAGMGVDSGLPDFRGDQGFWKAYPPLKHLGKNFVDMATPEPVFVKIVVTFFETKPPKSHSPLRA